MSVSRLEYFGTLAKARFFRLQARAQNTKRKYEREMSEDKINLIKKMHADGIRIGKIACQLSLTKEYVDAVCTLNTSTLTLSKG